MKNMKKRADFEWSDLLKIIPYYDESEARKLRELNSRVIRAEKPVIDVSDIDKKTEKIISNPDDFQKEDKKDGEGNGLMQLAGSAGGGWLAYEIAKSLMPEGYGRKKDRSTWEKVLSEVIPLGAAGLGAYGGWKLSKSAEDGDAEIPPGPYKRDFERAQQENAERARLILGQSAVAGIPAFGMGWSAWRDASEVRRAMNDYRAQPDYSTLEQQISAYNTPGRREFDDVTSAKINWENAADKDKAKAYDSYQRALDEYRKNEPKLTPPAGAAEHPSRFIPEKDIHLTGRWGNAVNKWKSGTGFRNKVRGFVRGLFRNDSPVVKRYAGRWPLKRGGAAAILGLISAERAVRAMQHADAADAFAKELKPEVGPNGKVMFREQLPRDGAK